jgi:hypothetical protein
MYFPSGQLEIHKISAPHRIKQILTLEVLSNWCSQKTNTHALYNLLKQKGKSKKLGTYLSPTA